MKHSPQLFRKLMAFAFLSIMLFFSSDTFASHFRGGNIKWERMPGNPYQVKFTVTEAWRTTAFFGTPPSIGTTVTTGSFFPGTGSFVNVNLIVTSVNLAEDWFSGSFTYIHNFPTSPAVANYIAYEESCCRIFGLSNNNSGNFRVQTVVTLGNNNDCPVSTVPPFINLPRNTTAATYQIPATDPNGDALSFALTPNGSFGSGTVQPTGLTVSSTGLLTFNTNGMSAGQLWSTSVTVTDSKGATTMLDLMLKITNQSTPPTYDYTVTPANSTNYLIQPGQTLSFNVKAQDADTGDVVSLSAVGLPVGASFTPGTGNPVTRSFSWTPTIGQLGTNQINFIAQDAAGIQTSTIVNITVSLKPSFDVGPSLGNNSFVCATPGTAISQAFQASDPDTGDRVVLTAPVTILGMSFSPTLPTAAANPTSSTLSWTPAASDWGLNRLVMKATDTYTEFAMDTVYYIVNNAPTITSTPSTTVVAGQLYTYLLSASDVNLLYGDKLELEEIHIPSFLSVVDNNNGTWTISGTPTIADSGDYNIEIEVADSMNHIGGTHCGNAIQNFTLTVNPCNITVSHSVTDVSCPGGSDGSIDLTVNNANNPTFTWSNAATTEDVSGLNAGTYTVAIIDANGCTAEDTVTIGTVPDVTAPIITCPGNISVNNDAGNCSAVVSFAATATDNCTSSPTITYSHNPGSTFPVGTTTVTATATDGSNNTASCTFDVIVTDNEAPNAVCKNYTLNLSGGTGTISASDINDGSTDNCGIASLSLSKTSFNCTNAGANTVTLTVTDVNGNSSTCNATVTVQYRPTCTIAVTPSNTTYTGGVATNIYLGYGPQSATITCNATGGAGFTYSWSPSANLNCTNCQSPVFTPTAAGNYSFTVTATNSNGCSTTCTVSFCVLDVRVPGQNNKVYLCHVPPGNPGNPQTLSISVNAVPAHLSGHAGDRLGNCSQSCGSAKGTEAIAMGEVLGEEFRVYPNPSTGVFFVEIPHDIKAERIVVMDIAGKVIDSKTNAEGKVQFNMSGLAKGIYMVQVMYGEDTYRTKLTVQ